MLFLKYRMHHPQKNIYLFIVYFLFGALIDTTSIALIHYDWEVNNTDYLFVL